jgi:hypothetical protein
MKRIIIRFPRGFLSGPTIDLFHRIEWFAEELQGAIARFGIGEVNESDRIHGVVCVDMKDSHNTGKAKEIVRKTLGKYKLTADAIVSIEPLPPTNSRFSH